MKQLFLTCGFVFLMVLAGGCSKDDEPDGGGSNTDTKGEFKVDGKKSSVNYGYMYYDYEDKCYEFVYCDINLMKYFEDGDDIEDINKAISTVVVSFDDYDSTVDMVAIGYKVNYSRETGTIYVNGDDCDDYVSFSYKKGKANISSQSIPLTGVDYATESVVGEFTGSFSLSGSPVDLDELDIYYAPSRSVDVIEVTDAKQIAFFKSLKSKNMALISSK